MGQTLLLINYHCCLKYHVSVSHAAGRVCIL